MTNPAPLCINAEVVRHNNILQSMLTALRDKNTARPQFYETLRQIGYMMTYEIVGRESMHVMPCQVQTPLGTRNGISLVDRIVQVEIQRAGSPLRQGGTDFLRAVGIDHEIGSGDAKRIEVPGTLDFKYELSTFKVPPLDSSTLLIVYDPMLGTGGTLTRVLDEVYKKGQPYRTVVAGVVSSLYGVNRMRKEHPDAILYTLDINTDGNKGLDPNGYIYQDLGDCGDRAYGKC